VRVCMCVCVCVCVASQRLLGACHYSDPYFQNLSFKLPENENHADWVMDIVSGTLACDSEIDKVDDRINKLVQYCCACVYEVPVVWYRYMYEALMCA